MFDVIPYWMWAASLLVLALVCGAALNPRESRKSTGSLAQAYPRQSFAREMAGSSSVIRNPDELSGTYGRHMRPYVT